MRPESFRRRLASLILRCAIQITPAANLDWARAILGELNEVEGDWAAQLWAIGGASLLAKQALLSMLLPNSEGVTVAPGGEAFAKEASVSRATLTLSALCASAVLALFLSPSFRQGFQLSLAQWHDVINVVPSDRQPSLDALARRAEKQWDAEGLAFVAVRMRNAGESARLAEEAVRLDPKLTWVYAVTAVGNPEIAKTDQWIPKLRQWDPQNALPYLITAESIDIQEGAHEIGSPHRVAEPSAAWWNAMAGVFQSAKLDTYLDRLRELDRRVVERYGFDDPYEVIDGEDSDGVPSYAFWDCNRYASSLLESGQILELQGDRKGAFEKYSAIARFDTVSDAAGRLMANQSVHRAYERLGAMSESESDGKHAELYASLARGAGRWTNIVDARGRRPASRMVSQWDASVVRGSGLFILSFVAAALVCALRVVAKSRSLRLNARYAGRFANTVMTGCVSGILLSSATLYLSYRPYSEIYRRYIRDGDASGIQQLKTFLDYTQFPLGVREFYQLPGFIFYFWLALSTFCVAAIFLASTCFFLSRARTETTI